MSSEWFGIQITSSEVLQRPSCRERSRRRRPAYLLCSVNSSSFECRAKFDAFEDGSSEMRTKRRMKAKADQLLTRSTQKLSLALICRHVWLYMLSLTAQRKTLRVEAVDKSDLTMRGLNKNTRPYSSKCESNTSLV